MKSSEKRRASAVSLHSQTDSQQPTINTLLLLLAVEYVSIRV